LALLGSLGAASTAAEPAARFRTWAPVASIPVEGKRLDTQWVGLGGAIYRLDRNTPSLAEIDLDTLGPRRVLNLSSVFGPQSMPYVRVEGQGFLLVAHKYPVARVALVDPGATRIVESHELAYGADPGGEMRDVVLEDDQIHVFFSSPLFKPARGPQNPAVRPKVQVATFDRRTGQLVRRGELGMEHIYSATGAGSVAYVVGSSEVVAVDLRNAQVMWRYHERSFLRGVRPGRDAVYVQEDKTIAKLDPKTGRKLIEHAIESQGNPGPLLVEDGLYLTSRGLARFDLNLKPTGQLSFDAWPIDHGACGPYWVGSAHDRLILARRDPLDIEQVLELEGDWQFDRTPLLCADDLVVSTWFNYNDIHRAKLVRFARVPAETVDASGLPPNTGIYASGRLLRPSDPLPLGAYRLDLFREGFQPQSADVVVKAGESARVSVPENWRPTPPVARTLQRNLPAGDLASLLGRAPHANPHRGRRYEDRWIELDRGRSLVARDHASGRILWSIDPLQALPGGQQEPTKTRFAQHDLLGALPQSGLVLVSTKGYLPNQLLAFDLATGASRWTAAIDSSGLETDSAIGAGDPIDEYLGLVWVRVNTFLEARDARDGRLVYRLRAGRQDSGIGKPLFHNGRVFFVFHEQLHGVRIADQKVLWRLRAAGRVLADPTSDDLILVDSKRVRRVSVDGKVLGTSKALPGSVTDLPPVIGPDAVYVCGHFSNMVYAVDKRTLATRWSFKDKTGSSPCPVLLSEKELLITSGDHGWLLDRSTGQVANTLDMKLGGGLDLAKINGKSCLVSSRAEVCAP
jgi:outer membrane protein assembly factor BamB